MGDYGTICFKDIAGISSESQKSESEKALLVGAGTFTTTIAGNPSPVAGIVYVWLGLFPLAIQFQKDTRLMGKGVGSK